MRHRIESARRRIIGGRDSQQDEYDCGFLNTIDHGEIAYAVVCDGMGGHEKGGAASAAACLAFTRSLSSNHGALPDILLEALDASNHAVEEAKAGIGVSKARAENFGTTLVAVVITDDLRCHRASVGDSLLYLYRDKALRRLNEDHSLAPILDQMVRDGELSREDADSDPSRYHLRSALTGQAVRLVDVPEDAWALVPGDMLLLASDGIETLSQREISSIALQSFGNPQALVDGLIGALERAGDPNQDNTAVIALSIGGDV